jgi:hypothetical protein
LTRGKRKGILEKGEREMSTAVEVDCYAGYKANQRPLAFSLGKKRMGIHKVLDQWYGPDHTYFKVLAEDANIYILRYGEAHDQWEVVFFKEAGYHGEISPGMRHGTSS